MASTTSFAPKAFVPAQITIKPKPATTAHPPKLIKLTPVEMAPQPFAIDSKPSR